MKKWLCLLTCRIANSSANNGINTGFVNLSANDGINAGSVNLSSR